MNKKLVGIIVSVIILVILLVAWALGGVRLQKDKDVKVISNQTEQQTNQKQKQPQHESNVSTNREKPSQESRENSSRQGENGHKQSENGNRPSENPNSQEKSKGNDISEVVPDSKEYSNSVAQGQDLVGKAVENSQVEQDGNRVSMNPTQTHLEERVYSIAGVVDQVALYKNSEGTQAQYKLDIKVQLEDKTLTLAYFTSANSVTKLKQGSKVTVEYQLTSDKAMVIKSLKDR
ncbi:hypothetical protein P4493_04405 [Bacillus thuringiensis]|uniref:Uncharacterized protein n=4 Tax=Bacillus thuringiensis TaxID=1428 RepID=A0A0B5NJ90_BACTU|nr:MULTISPECIES: hypothetical protein [Bacillus]MEC2534466.1 hypothetical protein [Bacillus cereus]MED1153767.1 hypothetical protein [Bacillus paranthracis]OUB09369.1 hypothetical protein BK708_33130 [Bacillus thuringiensis serovar yunnanensis]AFQ30081.1 hypothetical protein BTF1_29902 [Bacillus thuringiensis HD-789]AJG74011.1 hypothetical protein BF38_5881 [Bacillus thuringiensis]